MNNLTLIITALFLLWLLAIVPLATIWALNILFPLNIPYTFKAWLAALWIIGLIGGASFS